MKTAWVQSGGGAAGSVQAGVIEALDQAGMRPQKIFGTSAGALNAFGYSNMGAAGLVDLWKSIKSEQDVFTGNWWVTLPWKSGLKSPAPLRDILKKNHAKPEGQIPFEVCTLNLVTGLPCYFPHYDSKIVDMTVASAAMEGYVEPVTRAGCWYGDGGAVENVPLSRAIEWGADRIIVMLCHPMQYKLTDQWEPTNPISVLLRTYKARQMENFRNDIKLCLEKNDQLDCRKIDLHIIAPDVEIVDVLDFSAKKIEAGLEAGRLLGEAFLDSASGFLTSSSGLASGGV